MQKQLLTRGNRELFRRAEDERFPDLQSLWDRCSRDKAEARDRWHPPRALAPDGRAGRLDLKVGTDWDRMDRLVPADGGYRVVTVDHAVADEEADPALVLADA